MGVRAFLARMRERFATQDEMADWMTTQVGERVAQPTLSCWLSGERYPDRRSRQIIRRAFRVPWREWAGILLADELDDGEDARDSSLGSSGAVVV